jgi:hypothetical protein
MTDHARADIEAKAGTYGIEPDTPGDHDDGSMILEWDVEVGPACTGRLGEVAIVDEQRGIAAFLAEIGVAGKVPGGTGDVVDQGTVVSREPVAAEVGDPLVQ